MIENFPTLHDQQERDRLKESYSHLFNENENVNHVLVVKEIRKLTASVYHTLERINAPTYWHDEKDELEYDYEKRRNIKNKTVEKYNVILDRNYPIYRS